MAALTPYPFAALVRRAWRELEEEDSVFGLPRERFFLGEPGLDFSVRFHHLRASSPLGPAAGPHTQMAQNIVLAWLGGSRVFELKTVQARDDLEIPRPCIDMRTVGLNVEWSQELRLEESLDEYVKAAMLIELLRRSGRLPIAAGFGDHLFDLSVGYDLAGIRSERVLAFLAGMRDARGTIERLRGELPAELGPLRDAPFEPCLSTTVTLSTFHGCPPGEIEQIIRFLIEELGLCCIVKLNPMLLGAAETRRLLHDALGYHHLRVPDSAFERDATWDQAVDFIGRLRQVATAHGVGFGVKLTNTLIVENDQGFLAASEPEAYLSGPPLHVLAMHLVRRVRRTFGAELPISFSAGIDRHNFPDAVALGLVPVTVCSDLLRRGGYGRLPAYHAELARRMRAVGAATVDELVLAAHGGAAASLDGLGLEPEDPRLRACRAGLEGGGSLRAAVGDELFRRWVGAATLHNAERYVAGLAAEARYLNAHNNSPPRKIGRRLELFDCLTCDLCIPVCPNDANFRFRMPEAEIPIVKLRHAQGGWQWCQEGTLRLAERHQIANFVDFCNDCGNCDVFCPEDGGPYVLKPRFFRRAEDWRQAIESDGVHLERTAGGDVVRGRFEGVELQLEVSVGRSRFVGDGFEVSFDPARPAATVTAEGPEEIDLTYCLLLDGLRRAILDAPSSNYLNRLP